MNALIFFVVLTAAIALQYLIIYLSYLPVSRRYVTQKQMLHASFVVLGYSMMAGVLLGFAGLPKSLSTLVSAVLIYILGCKMLNQSKKMAWASCGIYIVIALAMGAGFICLMETNDAFRAIMMQKAE